MIGAAIEVHQALGPGYLEQVYEEALAVEMVAATHYCQVIAYLKATGLHLALLINFNVPMLKAGIKRIAR